MRFIQAPPLEPETSPHQTVQYDIDKTAPVSLITLCVECWLEQRFYFAQADEELIATRYSHLQWELVFLNYRLLLSSSDKSFLNGFFAKG